MLKHLKRKASLLQPSTTEVNHPGDDGVLKESKDKSEDVLPEDDRRYNQDIRNNQDMYPFSPISGDYLESTAKLVTPCAKGTYINDCEKHAQQSEGFSMYDHAKRSQTGTMDWRNLPPDNFDFRLPTDSDHLCNTFRTTCSDPPCYCLPKHIHPFSSKYENSCACMSHQQYSKVGSVDHCNYLSYFPPAAHQLSLHHHHHEGHPLCSPEKALSQHKPLYHSSFSHDTVGWSKYANYDTCFRNPPILNAKHCHYSWMHPEYHSCQSPTNYQRNPSEERQKLSLPLSRSTIISVVKSGNYETILQALDSPLHDETSPLYPLALQTVLDILDVIEKDFSDVYRKDSKVEADINLLSNFVKSMKMSTCGEDSKASDAYENFAPAANYFKEVTVAGQSTEMSDSSSRAPLCADVHSVCADAREIEMTVGSSDDSSMMTAAMDSREQILTDQLAGGSGSSVSMADNHVSEISVKPPAHPDKPSHVTEDVESNEEESNHKDCIGDDMKKSDAQKPGPSVQYNQFEDYSKEENDCTTSTSDAFECVNQNESEIHSSREETMSLAKCQELEDPTEEKPTHDVVTPSCESVDTVHPEEQKNGSDQEGKHENKEESAVSPSTKNHVSSEICSDIADLKTQVENVEEKNLDIDVVDALLDQTLYEASNQKEKVKPCYKKSISEESFVPGTTYRGKGYKVRPAVATSKAMSKSKLSVKTFVQIREKQSLTITETGAENLASAGSAVEKKNENENVVHISPALIDSDKRESDSTSNQCTQEMSKSPSNPSSPSSDNMERPDLRALLGKLNTCSSYLARSESDISSKGDFSKTRSGIEALNAIRNLPLPQEPSSSQSGIQKPLRTKSFHGKLLILRQSTEPPHPIPLEITDSSMVLRDPRLSLSNLMDHRRNLELKLLQWKDMDDIHGKDNPVNVSNNLSAINVRDPRIRRRLSEETNQTVSVASTEGESDHISVQSTAQEEMELPENTNADKLAQSKDDDNIKLLPCNSSKLPNDGDTAEPSNGKHCQGSGSGEELISSQKIHTSEQLQLLSTIESSHQSFQKVDTLSRFKESLSLLKIIKSDIKQQAAKVTETAGNADLIERLSDLRKEVEINLSATEVQKRKASGKQLTTLTGLLEDHFILYADIIMLTLWLDGFDAANENVKELPEFTEGVFGHQAAPSLRKIHKWIRNRYELDGLVDERLSKLVSSFGEGEDRGKKRSRSRSTSTSSDKIRRRRSDGSRERYQKQDMAKKSHNVIKGNDVEKSDPPPSKKKRKGSTQSKSLNVSSVVVVVSSAESDKKKEEKQLSGSENSPDGDKHDCQQQDEEMTPAKKKNQNVCAIEDIQDLPQKMESIKQKVLIALRTRKTKVANRCLRNLTELSAIAHAQLEDENKTYTSLQDASPDTKARFHDVVKGIQRLLVDCQILIYSLSWKANKRAGRKAKDRIWNMAEKSSNKPSYEEELAFLLSLRKCYLSQELWNHIKNDVDDRIASMQKKCRSRQGSKSIPTDNLDYSKEMNPSKDGKTNSKFVSHSCAEPLAPQMLSSVSSDFDNLSGSCSDFSNGLVGNTYRYNFNSDIMHDYTSSHLPNARRDNFFGGPIQNFQPVPIALSYPTQYPQYGPGQGVPYQSQSFTQSERRNGHDWWHEERPEEWDVRNNHSTSGHLGHCTQLAYAPPRVLYGSGT